MILGYCRVSSADQAADNRSSLQTQTDVIEGFARTRGVDRFGVQIYTDAGVSGCVKFAKREGGADLLAAMKPGDIVIASKLDRMFRSSADALAMMEVFKERGVHLYLFDMGNDPVTDGGMSKFLFTILAAVADMERVRIRERTAEGRKAKRAKGGVVGNIPFGFRKVGEGRAATMEPDEKELEAAARMKEMWAKRQTFPNIALHLADAGFVSRAGKPYTAMAIRRVVAEIAN